MTNYEKIKFLLEMGVYKGVEVCYIYQHSGVTEHITFSNFFGTRSLESLGEMDTPYSRNTTIFDKDDVERLNQNGTKITSITPIPNPPKLLPVGTKVRVFEGYGSYHDLYTIEKVIEKECCYVIREESPNHDTHKVPSRAVVPVWED